MLSPTFCWMLCDPSVFYRIWFWSSADVENTKPDHDEKSLHRHTIPCFEARIARNTTRFSHPETEVKRCLRRAAWVRCRPSTPRRDPRTGELARNCRRRAQSFFSKPLQQRAQSGMSSRPAQRFKPRKGNTFRASGQLVIFKKSLKQYYRYPSLWFSTVYFFIITPILRYFSLMRRNRIS